MRPLSLTFCFLRLQDSHAWAVRCLLSGSTLGRVMATIQSSHADPTVVLLEAWLVLAVALELDVESLLLPGESLGSVGRLLDTVVRWVAAGTVSCTVSAGLRLRSR
jgi:hypothetical protein